jgi:light-regulated signal transduction histidine kinase (bacteriophytochrome)
MAFTGVLHTDGAVPEDREACDGICRHTARLEVANAELKSFAHSLAHELRAPIAVISGFSHMLGRSLDEQAPESARHYLRRIRAAGQQLDEYVEALLSLAHITQAAIHATDVDLSSIARTALADLQMRDPGRVAVIHIEEGVRAQGDPSLLKMVLENLLGNAWKFTGRRSISEIRFSALSGPDRQPVYCVKDNGAGFDMKFVAKLFGDFQRLHSQFEFPGTGVGLSNVHRIVERHGGSVWAESVEGEGATFYFTLAAKGVSIERHEEAGQPVLLAAMKDSGIPCCAGASRAVHMHSSALMDATRA